MATHANPRTAGLAREEIEDEHRELFRLIDGIKNAIEAGDTDFMARSLGDFHGKVWAHFQHEEEIMRLYRYPYYDDHKVLHDGLLRALEDCFDKERAGEPVRVSLRVLTHLTSELHHCVAADRHLTAYLGKV